jgi:hypothetical protein
MAASLERATYPVRALWVSVSRMDSAASTPPALASTNPSPARAFVVLETSQASYFATDK